jgi:uncharacterized RDD family membrane protein YckC
MGEGVTVRGRGGGMVAAPAWLRVFAALLDLVPVSCLAAAVTWAWFDANPTSLPPRYWNWFDYAVDLVNGRPDLVFPPIVAFAGSYVVWETLAARVLGCPPFARALGMRLCTSRGRRPGTARLAARAVMGLALACAALVGPAVALVSPRRRMLHDILAGCLVLRGEVPEGWSRGGVADGSVGPPPGPGLFLDGPRRWT